MPTQSPSLTILFSGLNLRMIVWYMSSFRRRTALLVLCILALAPLLCAQVDGEHGLQTGPRLRAPAAAAAKSALGSPYIPLDSWIYPAVVRLYELGYLPTAYLGMRPWTRASVAHMLQLSQDDIQQLSVDFSNSEEVTIYDRLLREFAPELHHTHAQFVPESVYTRVTGIQGPIFNDSYHVGQTIVNDYGRPYQPGFNNVTGYSAYAAAGRFSLYVRDEYQHSPAAAGYSTAVVNALNANDIAGGLLPMAPSANVTIPQGNIVARDDLRIVEANLSAHLWSHEISFGKSDAWLGPAYGAAMAWSNNAENIYSFRINRVEPLYIPGLSRYAGMFRYDFFVGSLKGHSAPNDPWIHAEKFSIKPTANLEFGFERTVIWGGKGHVPITLTSFMRSFFSFTAQQDAADKLGRQDPGARFTQFDFTWRVPWQRHLITLYTDSVFHNGYFPFSSPRETALRPGIYLSRLPGLNRVDLRIEGVTTNPHDPGSVQGSYIYWERIQEQGYTNKSQILGDWIGRESTGGQAWITWHRTPTDSFQLEYRRNKAASDFIPGGTTQQQLALHAQLRPTPDLGASAPPPRPSSGRPLSSPPASSMTSSAPSSSPTSLTSTPPQNKSHAHRRPPPPLALHRRRIRLDRRLHVLPPPRLPRLRPRA